MKKLRLLRTIIIGFALLLFFLLPDVCSAGMFDAVERTLSDYYQQLFAPLGIFLAGVVVVIGGIMYTTSQGDPQKTGRAKELIVGSLIGLGILLTAGYIIASIV
ncbi:MAG TPA: TrbC/VirB2 family protein [bacterium]|jgi:type IV secretory pathway VirB2 component (pilin)|nr:TrbC/VirB2 family protein [bacterium]